MHRLSVCRLDSYVDLGNRPMIHTIDTAAYDGAG